MINFIQFPHRDGIHEWRFSDQRDERCTFGNDNYCVVREIEFLAPVRLKNGTIGWKEEFSLQSGDRVFISDLDAKYPVKLDGRITKIVRNGLGFDPKIVVKVGEREKLYSLLCVDKKIPFE